jgi:hypothetical protein
MTSWQTVSGAPTGGWSVLHGTGWSSCLCQCGMTQTSKSVELPCVVEYIVVPLLKV